MLVAVNWIEDFVDLSGVERSALWERVTLGTCEVEAVLQPPALWQQVKVVELLEVLPHPHADTLHLVTINSGSGQFILVCGANNLYVGMRALWAPVGTQMAPDLVLTAKKIRGVVSEGMLCSQRELGLGDDHDGVVELTGVVSLGQSLAALLRAENDSILDIDNKSLTHRPDLWGIYGMARECGVLFQRPLRAAFGAVWQEGMRQRLHSPQPSPLKLRAQGDSALLGYTGLSFAGVTVEPSPLWMQGRLLSAGVRPINNLVDISNYVMLEMGQPNHIFDLDTLCGGELCIYRLSEAQEFVTLDRQPRQLQAGDTVIADAQGVQVLAGIMGGLHSGVSPTTTRIFVEVACWKAGDIRRSSTRLGLRSDSSLRYEKSLDPYQLTPALLRLAELLLQLCPGARVVGQQEWAQPLAPWQAPRIELPLCKVEKLLGCKIAPPRVVEILTALEFVVEQQPERLWVQVPSFRATRDVAIAEDLVEEIGRIVGYNNIPPTPPQVQLQHALQLPSRQQEWKIRHYLAGEGRAQESFSYPLVGEDILRQCLWPQDHTPLRLLNPLSPQMDRMRPSLIPSALAQVAANLAQHPFPRFRFFELGRSYLPCPPHFCQEYYQLLLLGFDNQDSPLLELRDLVEGLLPHLHYPLRLVEEPLGPTSPVPLDWPGLNPRELLSVVDADGATRGALLSVHPRLLQSLRIRGRVSLLLLDYSQLRRQSWPDPSYFQPLSRFPASLFDCSVKVGNKIPVARVLAALAELKRAGLLREVKVLTDFPLDAEHRSLTLRSTFQSQEATLDSRQLEQLQHQVMENLAAAGFPLKR